MIINILQFIFVRISLKNTALLFAGLSMTAALRAQVFADFETPQTTPAVSGGNAAVVDNPYKTGANTSDKCGLYEKASGNWYYVSMNFPEPVSFGKSTNMTFKVYCSTAGRVYYKFWNGSDVVIEHWAHDWNYIPSANQWNEFTMDVSSAQGKTFTTLQIAAGVDNNDAATVYFDGFKFSNPLAEAGIPVADLKVSPKLIYADSIVTFDASGSFDWNNLPLTYDWDFGDGTTFSGSDSIVYHQFSEPGFYSVSLVLSNTDGKSVTEKRSLFIFNLGDNFSDLAFTDGSTWINSKVEGIFQLSKSYSNPYNPDTISVDAIITKPDSTNDTIPCFYYIRSFPFQGEWINDSTLQCWMLRFSSDQTGIHKVLLHARDNDGEMISDEYLVELNTSVHKGFVYVDTLNKQYYRHLTGEPYLPIGENVAWSNKKDKIKDYWDHIVSLGENKANMLRYWTVTFAGQSLEAKDGLFYYKGIGDYSQQAAGLLDSVFDLCSKYDLQIMLAIWQHGILSENVNSNWDLNPYNTANGGFLNKPAEFFNNSYAKYLSRNLLRYYVARWGYSTNLFSWELFNEVDLTGNTNTNPPSWVTDVDNWHEEMGEYIRQIDPYDHIITTSLSGWMDHPLVSRLGDNKFLDVLQFHSYDTDVSGGIISRFNNIKGKTDLPVLCGEFGKSNLEESGDEVRRAFWIGYFYHLPTMHWNWEKAIVQGWYDYYKPVAEYFNGSDLVKEGNPKTISIPVIHQDVNLKAIGLSTDTGNYYIYIYHKSFAYDLSGVFLELENFPIGYYRLTWYNPVSGDISEPDTIVIADTQLEFSVRDFSKEIALKLEFLSDYKAPIAIAGEDQILPLGATASISGESSISPDGLPVSYYWTIIGKPEGSNLIIEDPSAESFNITLQEPGRYLFSLMVNDGEKYSFPDTLEIKISVPPVAFAGEDRQESVGNKVSLDGSGSYDDDGDPLTYLWTMIEKPSESVAELDKPTFSGPSFTPDIEGNYSIMLVVNDGLQNSEPDTINIGAMKTGLNGVIADSFFKLYPNPVRDFVIISPFSLSDQEYTYMLTDITGKVVLIGRLKLSESDGSGVIQLPDNLSKGIYMLKLTRMDSSEFMVTRIVKL